ncbi:TetR/AcrR family transcriptional regulator [Neobacillus soli]|uniref:TetR/AcrR family transcriptional regulator n=1 Tax=Neobacillus soli TaxID=220688 RepID=UPI000A0004FB|nr:TetR/AcrR family transcriptional regulator [Neobacillus soli]
MKKEIDGRTKRALLTKQKLLNAAGDIFIENGFEKTTISQIIKKAGIGYGSAYTYFRGKDDILIALMDDVMEQFYTIAEQSYDPTSLPEARVMIVNQVKLFLSLGESEKRILRVFYEAKGYSQAVEVKWKSIRENFVNRIEEDIKHVQAIGLAKTTVNSKIIAKSWFFVNEMYLWDIVNNDSYPYSIEEIAGNITETYTTGLYE